MDRILTVGVILAITAILCDGQCFSGTAIPVRPGEKPPLGCYWDGHFLGVNTHMTKNCQSCYCSEGGGLSCCVNGMHITHVPDECKIITAEDGCGERAVTKEDETVECMHDVQAVSRRYLH
ncbi:uncharacterized protein [Argopecten irradians]|uniref:uncharacterized protein n=1 Tax=Argopecten irradians TaxID=31199 RepID=UPI00371D5128